MRFLSRCAAWWASGWMVLAAASPLLARQEVIRGSLDERLVAPRLPAAEGIAIPEEDVHPRGWVEPLDRPADALDEPARDILLLRMAGRLAAVGQCSYVYSLGWAHPLDAGDRLGDWTPEQPLSVVYQSGRAGFDESLAWWRESIADVGRYPVGQPIMSMVGLAESDGTTLRGISLAMETVLLRGEVEVERFLLPGVEKAFGFDLSTARAAPLPELCWRHRDSFVAIPEGGQFVRLYGRLPLGSASDVPGNGARPVSILVHRRLALPLSITSYSPQAFCPGMHVEMRWWEPWDSAEGGRLYLPRAVVRQVYTVEDPLGVNAWLQGDCLAELRAEGFPDEASPQLFDDPIWQARAWRLVRKNYGQRGPSVVPLGGPEITQPNVLRVHRYLAVNEPDPAAQRPHWPTDHYAIYDARRQAAWRIEADGSRSVLQVDRRPYIDGKPITDVAVREMQDGFAGAELPDNLREIGGTPADLGVVLPGATAVRTMKLANVGLVPLTATVEFASCGCLDPAVEPSTIAPGEACEIRCRVAVSAAPGTQYHVVRVRFRNPENPADTGDLVEMPVFWKADLRREVNPWRVRLRVPADREQEFELFIRDDSGPVLDHISAVTCTTDDVELVGIDGVSLHTARATFRVRPAPVPRETVGTIQVHWSDDRIAPSQVVYQVARLDPYRAARLPLDISQGEAETRISPRHAVERVPDHAAVVLGSLPAGVSIDQRALARSVVRLTGGEPITGVGWAMIRVFATDGVRLIDVPVVWGAPD